jgi:hypothetical protein
MSSTKYLTLSSIHDKNESRVMDSWLAVSWFIAVWILETSTPVHRLFMGVLMLPDEMVLTNRED